MAWIAYEMYFKVTDQYNEKWQYDWITSDFWYVAAPLVLMPCCSCSMPLERAQHHRMRSRMSFADDFGKLGKSLFCMLVYFLTRY